MFSSKIYTNRRNELLSKGLKGVALFFGNREVPMNYPSNTYRFRQDSSFVYFFGLQEPNLVAAIDFDSGKQIIFGDDVDIDDIIWMGPQKSVKERAEKSGITETAPLNKLGDFIAKVQSERRTIHILPSYRAEVKIFIEEVLGIRPHDLKNKASIDLIKAIVAIRSVKAHEEIAELDLACDIGYEMHITSMKMAKPGIFEREIAGRIEGIALSYGGIVSFPVILSINGQTLHNHHHHNMLKEGDLMITDAGFEAPSCYASDFTRVVPVGGNFSVKQKEIYNIVLKANNEATALIKPGVTYQSIHYYAAEVIAEGLKELGLMQGDAKEAVVQGAHALFFPHGLGHMMGLDVHDMEDLGENYVGYDDEIKRSELFGHAFLRLGKRLKEGYVLTVEPGIYFIPELISLWKSENKFKQFINYSKVEDYLNFGGIRLEDDILVTAQGHRLLGKKRVPVTVEEIENTMAI